MKLLLNQIAISTSEEETAELVYQLLELQK